MSRYELGDGTYSDQYKVGDKFTFTGLPYEANIDWTPEDLEGLFEFVFDDEPSCPKFKSLVSGMEDYEDWRLLSKYTGVKPTKEDTQAYDSELEEAYAHIETLQEALEDAVREIFSLKHQLIAKAANTCLGIVQEESESKSQQFKPVQEYTLEDWEAAQSLGWVFETNVGSEDTVERIDYNDSSYPVCFFELGWKTLDGFENYHEGSRTECDVNITRRIE